MLTIDRRIRKLIEKLIEKPHNNLDFLLRDFSLNKSQLDYSLKKINGLLEDKELKKIEFDGNTINFPSESRQFFLNGLLNNEFFKSYVMDFEERRKYIFLMLFYHPFEYLSSYHFLSALNVGRTTLMNDLREFQRDIEKFNITLEYNREKGYYLHGEESFIRAGIISMILNDLSEDADDFLYKYFLFRESIEEKSFDNVVKIINDKLKLYNIELLENRMKEFYTIFFFLLPRIQIDCPEVQINEGMVVGTKEFDFSEDLLKEFGKNDRGASVYICCWLLGVALGDTENTSPDYPMIYELTKLMVSRFEMLSGVKFNDEKLLTDRLYRHFRPAYYRLFFRFPIINNLYARITQEYASIYSIVKEMMNPISTMLGIVIPKEEVAFLSMHFASFLLEFDETIEKQTIGVITCPNGIGSSAIVYNELREMFPDFILLGPMETENLLTSNLTYDVIFTTSTNIKLYDLGKPIFVVDPVMTNREKSQLIYEVYNGASIPFTNRDVDEIINIIEKYLNIDNQLKLKQEIQNYLLSERYEDNVIGKANSEKNTEIRLCQMLAIEYIQTSIKVRSWEEALFISASPLIDSGVITRTYIDTIIRETKKDGPFYVLMEDVALVHSKPTDGSLKLGLGITVLSEKVIIINKPVKYIFTLSALDNKQHLKAMAELVSLFENPDFFNFLDTEKDPKLIYEWICKKIQ